MSDLRELPIIWLVQDNEWDISAHASEIRSHDASTLAKAFPQIKAMEIDGADAEASMNAMVEAFDYVETSANRCSSMPMFHCSGITEWRAKGMVPR